MKKIRDLLCLVFVLLLIDLTHCELLLDGVPFEFELAGPVSYIPTSGGINIPGYVMRVGYTKHQWIGKFLLLIQA